MRKLVEGGPAVSQQEAMMQRLNNLERFIKALYEDGKPKVRLDAGLLNEFREECRDLKQDIQEAAERGRPFYIPKLYHDILYPEQKTRSENRRKL